MSLLRMHVAPSHDAYHVTGMSYQGVWALILSMGWGPQGRIYRKSYLASDLPHPRPCRTRSCSLRCQDAQHAGLLVTGNAAVEVPVSCWEIDGDGCALARLDIPGADARIRRVVLGVDVEVVD